MAVIGEPVEYVCQKCGKTIQWSEADETICPCCGSFIYKHKGCGGRVVKKGFRRY